jgi:hypothetical protein
MRRRTVTMREAPAHRTVNVPRATLRSRVPVQVEHSERCLLLGMPVEDRDMDRGDALHGRRNETQNLGTRLH